MLPWARRHYRSSPWEGPEDFIPVFGSARSRHPPPHLSRARTDQPRYRPGRKNAAYHASIAGTRFAARTKSSDCMPRLAACYPRLRWGTTSRWLRHRQRGSHAPCRNARGNRQLPRTLRVHRREEASQPLFELRRTGTRFILSVCVRCTFAVRWPTDFWAVGTCTCVYRIGESEAQRLEAGCPPPGWMTLAERIGI